MTDHAEEWRAEVHKLSASWDKISAERQQAIDKLWEQTEAAANLLTEVERLEAERQQAQQAATALSCDVTRLSEERQQAIDALRRAKTDIGVIGREQRSWQRSLIVDKAGERISAALVKLGDKP